MHTVRVIEVEKKGKLERSCDHPSRLSQLIRRTLLAALPPVHIVMVEKTGHPIDVGSVSTAAF